jgi:hypothetical protein
MPPRLPPTFLRTTVYTNEVLGNVIVQGNIRSGFITANVIYGNVSGVSIVAQNIYGNLTSNNWTPGNVTNLNITGNMTAEYFIGNGSQLSGIATYTLPGSAAIDISGNVIGDYANVTTLLGATGNVGNVRMVGGNVAVSGQINVLGNVVATNIIGSGTVIVTTGNIGNVRMDTGVVTAPRHTIDGNYYLTLSGSNPIVNLDAFDYLGYNRTANSLFLVVGGNTKATIDGEGNLLLTRNVNAVDGNFSGNVRAITGNIGNTRFLGGNVVVSGQINALGDVVAPFFIGNGSQLTGIAAALPGVLSEDVIGNLIGAYANVDTIISNTATITSAGNANVLTVAGTTTNTIGSLIQGTTLRGNNSSYSLLRLDNTGGRILDINGNGEMSLTSATTADIMSISTRTGALVGNALSIVVPRLSFTDYSFISCRNTNGMLFNVDGRGMVTAQCAVNGNVVNVVSSSATNTNDMIRIQSSASAAQPFNMISAKNAAGNVFRVSGNGAVFGVGAYNTSGADYAEMFEWEDGNAADEDRRGMTVVKGNNGVIRMATGADDPATIFGVVSTNPSIVGDAKWDEWSGRYLRDRFGSKLSNAVYYISNVSNENERVRCASTAKPQKGYEKIVSSEFIENPAYDPNVTYVSREGRKEWATIGLVGKLMVLPDQVVNPNWILFRNISHPDGDILEYIVK